MANKDKSDIIQSLTNEFFTPSPYFYAHLLNLSNTDAWRLLFDSYITTIGIGELNGIEELSKAFSSSSCCPSGQQDKLKQTLTLLSTTYWIQRSQQCSPIPEFLRIIKKQSISPGTGSLPTLAQGSDTRVTPDTGILTLASVSRESLTQYFLRFHYDVYHNYLNSEMTVSILKSWIPAIIQLMTTVAIWEANDTGTVLDRMKFFGSLLKQYNQRGKIADWGKHLILLAKKRIVTKKNQLSYYLHCTWMSLVWTYPFDTCMKYSSSNLLGGEDEALTHLRAMHSGNFNFKVEKEVVEDEALMYGRYFIEELKKY
jgi:hypothetical protein